jgi:hypothetical protein
MEDGLLLAGTMAGQSSHGLRSYLTLKLIPHVTFGSEMKKKKMAMADRVNGTMIPIT